MKTTRVRIRNTNYFIPADPTERGWEEEELVEVAEALKLNDLECPICGTHIDKQAKSLECPDCYYATYEDMANGVY